MRCYRTVDNMRPTKIQTRSPYEIVDWRLAGWKYSLRNGVDLYIIRFNLYKTYQYRISRNELEAAWSLIVEVRLYDQHLFYFHSHSYLDKLFAWYRVFWDQDFSWLSKTVLFDDSNSVSSISISVADITTRVRGWFIYFADYSRDKKVRGQDEILCRGGRFRSGR